jgi:hypothetical protein
VAPTASTGINIASEGVGWDLVTLFVIVPALAVTLPSLLRGTLRGMLLAAGFLVYFLYQYAEYAMALAYGPLFPVYVGIVALSVSGIALLLTRIDVESLPARFGPQFPRRAGDRLRPVHGRPARGDVGSTHRAHDHVGFSERAVWGYDPRCPGLRPRLSGAAGTLHAVTVYRRLPVGYVLAAVVIVKGASIALGIGAMLVVEWLATGEPQLPPIVVFGVTAMAGFAIAARIYRGIDARQPAMPEPAARPLPV